MRMRGPSLQDGSLELAEGGLAIQICDAGLRLPDGTVAARVASTSPDAEGEDQPDQLAAAFDADAYCNAVSMLEERCFTQEEVDQVIRSRQLRKQALQGDQVPKPFAVPSQCEVRVPGDWRQVRTHKDLRVRSWLDRVGTWGALDASASFKSWQRDAGSAGVPSVEDLRAHGYLQLLFGPCAERVPERQRLLGILRQPETAVAQYVVQHHNFWQRPESVNRLDEIEGHFEGMTRGDFQREAPPPVLLARLERDRPARHQQSRARFSSLKLVDTCILEAAEMSVELITTERELSQAAQDLKNCAASYLQRAEEGECLLLVLKRAGKLVAMAEWSTSSQQFVQLVEHCNRPIRDEWGQVFRDAAKALPQRLVITTSSHRPLTGPIFLDLACYQQIQMLSDLDEQGRLTIPELIGIPAFSPSLLPGAHALSSLGTRLARYPLPTLEDAESLLDISLSTDDPDLAQQTYCISGPCDAAVLALKRGKLHVAQSVMEVGADVNAPGSYGRVPLAEALSEDDIELATLLLKCGADVNAVGRAGKTALLEASNDGELRWVQLLVRHGADVNAADEDGRTPLSVAVFRGDLKMAQWLVKKGAQSSKSLSGETLLHDAVYDLDILQWVLNDLEAAADVHAKTSEGCTPLHEACRSSDVDAPSVVQMLLNMGADVAARTSDGNTPLHVACTCRTSKKQRSIVIQRLLKFGADVAACTSDGYTPLHEVLRWRCEDTDVFESTKLLLDAGADVNARTADGRTPLHEGCGAGCPEQTLEALIEAGAHVNARAADSETPLSCVRFAPADFEYTLAVTKLLLASGADINISDQDGTTTFHRLLLCSPESDLRSVVDLMLESGADVNARAGDGRTVLHDLAGRGLSSILSSVLDAGADVNAETGDGHTPLHAAVRYPPCDPKTVELLLGARADVQAQTSRGMTPVLLAVSKGCRTDGDTMKVTSVLHLLADAAADMNARDSQGRTPLSTVLSHYMSHYSISQSDLALAKCLVQAGADPNAEDEHGRTPLCCACRDVGRKRDDCTFAELLLEAGARVNAPESLTGTVPLLIASRSFRNLELVQLLVGFAADVNVLGPYWQTPLSVAMSAHINARSVEDRQLQENTLRFLVESRADVNARIWWRNGAESHARPLHWALFGQRHEQLDPQFLLESGADPDAVDLDGLTPLVRALGRRSSKAARRLLKFGADVNAVGPEGRTALAEAVLRGKLRWVQLLVLRGADVNAADVHGATPLWLAVCREDLEIANWLLKTGAQSSKCVNGATLLHIAVSNLDVLQWALNDLEAAADINAKTSDGRTPLHYACCAYSNSSIIQMLLSLGADVAARTSDGHTPLHEVLRYREYRDADTFECAKVLLDARADVNALTTDGRTPLHEVATAYSSMHAPDADTLTAFLNLLLDSGADVNAQTAVGRTPLHEALLNGACSILMDVFQKAGADIHLRAEDGSSPAEIAQARGLM